MVDIVSDPPHLVFSPCRCYSSLKISKVPLWEILILVGVFQFTMLWAVASVLFRFPSISFSIVEFLFEVAGYNVIPFASNVFFLLVFILFLWAKSATLLGALLAWSVPYLYDRYQDHIDPKLFIANVTQQVLTVAKAVEDKLDDEIATLDRLDMDDMEVLREKRLQQMKKMAEKQRLWISLIHGDYSNREGVFFRFNVIGLYRGLLKCLGKVLVAVKLGEAGLALLKDFANFVCSYNLTPELKTNIQIEKYNLRSTSMISRHAYLLPLDAVETEIDGHKAIVGWGRASRCRGVLILPRSTYCTGGGEIIFECHRPSG
ncbi:hypothetical protein SAY87_021429 [Trapa incisa]|uniref:Reticulon domain-containing protein n=1 Tax=Trapa incisa TaxID=236973 RepID=A0AAN7JRP2_9MYRT|nr:hypothetical protein SAY87_021429 [Trapa incisa]